MSVFLKIYSECPIQFELLRRLYEFRSQDDGDFGNILGYVEEHPELKLIASRAFRELTPLSPFAEFPLKQSIELHGCGVLVHEVALQAMNMLTPDYLDCYDLGRDRFLEFNCAVSVWMEELAGMLRRDPMQSFVIGQVYNIGMLPIVRVLARVKPSLKMSPELNISARVKCERKETGTDFIQVGVQLLEKWGFPDEVTIPIRNHLHPSLSSRHREMSVLLHLSTLMADLSLKEYPMLPMGILPERLLYDFGLDSVEIANCIPLAAEKIQALRYRVATDAAFA